MCVILKNMLIRFSLSVIINNACQNMKAKKRLHTGREKNIKKADLIKR